MTYTIHYYGQDGTIYHTKSGITWEHLGAEIYKGSTDKCKYIIIEDLQGYEYIIDSYDIASGDYSNYDLPIDILDVLEV